MAPGETPVPPGRYFTENEGYRYTFTTPSPGWWMNVYPDVRVVGKEHAANGPLTRLFIFGEVRSVFTNACHWKGTDAFPGPTVDEFVAALTAVNGFESSEPSDTVVDGYSGKHLRLTVPATVNMADCDDGRYHGIEGFFDIYPGQVQDVWVLDLDGNRHVTFSAFEGNTPTAVSQELTELFKSLQIDPVTP